MRGLVDADCFAAHDMHPDIVGGVPAVGLLMKCYC